MIDCLVLEEKRHITLSPTVVQKTSILSNVLRHAVNGECKQRAKYFRVLFFVLSVSRAVSNYDVQQINRLVGLVNKRT